MSEPNEESHRVQINFGPLWSKIVKLGYKGSVNQKTRQMWTELIAKEEGHEFSGDETRLKSLQKDHGDAVARKMKMLKQLDPKSPPETALRERPILVRFAQLFIAAGGRLESPSDIVNPAIKANLFKKVREAEKRLDGSKKVLSQRLPAFINYLLAENDIEKFERLISAPPAPSKPIAEAGGKSYEEFTKAPEPKARPVFIPPPVPAVASEIATKVVHTENTAEKMGRLKDIMYEVPEISSSRTSK